MTAVIDARDADQVADWLDKTIICDCDTYRVEPCAVHVAINLLREARRFEAWEAPI